MGCQKLGQPVPDSNLVEELKRPAPQTAHPYVPLSWLSQYSPVKGASVPLLTQTSYCSGVSFDLSLATSFLSSTDWENDAGCLLRLRLGEPIYAGAALEAEMKHLGAERISLAAMAVILLLGNGAAFASAGTQAPAVLKFSVGSDLGAVQDLGDQTYSVSGGQVGAAAIGGIPLDPGATVTFSLNAQVQGTKITGTASFQLEGKTLGIPMSASGTAVITSSLTISQVGGVEGAAAVCPGAGAQACGELPVLFGGAAEVQVTRPGSTTHDLTVLFFENPYFNPFGKPIVVAALDKSVVFAATYNVGTILWQGSQVGGPITGTLGGSTPVSGVLGLDSTEFEDLVTGIAIDQGSISLSSMTPSSLDAAGTYEGTSHIPPPTPQDDCSTLLGFPAGSGVCTMTGFDSSGSYVMSGPAVRLAGFYSTVWTVPALAFSSTSTAIATF